MANTLYATKPWRDYRSRVLTDTAECAFARLAGDCRGALHVHHIEPVAEGGDPFPAEDQVLTLCARHHRQLHWMRERNELKDRPRWKRCRHHHVTPEGRRQCEYRLNRAAA